MPRWGNRFKPWPVLASMAFCAFTWPTFAFASEPAIAALLEQTERLRTADHPRFLNLLKELHQQTASMSLHERWQLRYLDAWQAAFQGDYANADAMLQDVIDHSGDATLVTKASAMLMNDMVHSKHYGRAFELANRLTTDLPKVQDRLTRFLVLANVSQLLRSAGQYELATHYIREMPQTIPPGESLCKPATYLVTVLYASHKLTSSGTELQQGIDACQVAAEPLYTDTILLVKASLYLDEDQPRKAITLLEHIAPNIRADQYYVNALSYQVEMAQAYWKLGDDDNARKAALAALATSDPGDVNESLRDAYEVLYRIGKKHNNITAALTYYEHFVAQDTGYLNEVSAKTLAYDVAQQRMLIQKFETEKLSKQNKILRLQEALATKAAETSRLYIALLLMVLASIVYWLLRIKRSQLRFKRLARLDGLTGILNHQHFIGGAHRALHTLEKRKAPACLIAIDLDHFKHVNDTHGHAMGDAVLRGTVAICKQHLRPSDLFGRLGGEEFGVLLADCSSSQGLAIANRIRTTIEATSVDVDGYLVSFSASFGLASTDMHGYKLQRLYKEADAALYQAKREGRNRVVADVDASEQQSRTA